MGKKIPGEAVTSPGDWIQLPDNLGEFTVREILGSGVVILRFQFRSIPAQSSNFRFATSLQTDARSYLVS